MNEKKLNLLAALFARSNMGHSVGSYAHHEGFNLLPAAIYFVCGDLIEDTDHAVMFEDEARSWKSRLRDPSVMENYRKSSPHVFAAAGV